MKKRYSQTCSSGHLCTAATWLQRPLQFLPHQTICTLIALYRAATCLQGPLFPPSRVAAVDRFDMSSIVASIVLQVNVHQSNVMTYIYLSYITYMQPSRPYQPPIGILHPYLFI